MILEIIYLAFFVLGVVGVTFAISVPLTGVLVRFRANYSAKRLQLDTEGGMEPPTGQRHLEVRSIYMPVLIICRPRRELLFRDDGKGLPSRGISFCNTLVGVLADHCSTSFARVGLDFTKAYVCYLRFRTRQSLSRDFSYRAHCCYNVCY